MMIRSRLDLPTLRIMVAPQRERFTEALFQVVRGDDQPRDIVRCSLSDLGLPNALTELDPVNDDALTIPQRVIDELRVAVDEIGEPSLLPASALWLEFPSPRGFLYIMPWERLLAPLGRTVFRLPSHLVRLQAPNRRLEVAICVSTPMTQGRSLTLGIIEGLVRAYQNLDARVHIFADLDWFNPVAMRFHDRPFVVVHDPSTAARYERPRPYVDVESITELSDPWLLWMRDETGTRPLDFAHFVSHGYMSGGQGAIALAMSPNLNTGRTLSPFIGSVELNTFLTHVGAWGLVLTGPYDNYSDVGLRELADAIALIRPGITITHDWGRDQECRQLDRVLRCVLGFNQEPANVWSAITCWADPRFVELPEQREEGVGLSAHGGSAFITAAIREALADPRTETWVASAARALEALQMRWLPDATDTPTDEAAVIALRNVAALVDRHVERTYPRGEGG